MKVPRSVVIKDRVPQVVTAMNELVGKQVLIGIPEDTTDRHDDDEGPITNAALGYIHEFGAPGANIPARPFLIPGVQKATREAVRYLQLAAKAAMDGNRGKMDQALTAAGLTAEASVKNEITTGDFVPLKPSTIRGRARKRGAKAMRAAEKQYLGMVAKGMSPLAAQIAAGIRPLIDTGQLRNSITHVVRTLSRQLRHSNIETVEGERSAPTASTARGAVKEAAEGVAEVAESV